MVCCSDPVSEMATFKSVTDREERDSNLENDGVVSIGDEDYVSPAATSPDIDNLVRDTETNLEVGLPNGAVSREAAHLPNQVTGAYLTRRIIELKDDGPNSSLKLSFVVRETGFDSSEVGYTVIASSEVSVAVNSSYSVNNGEQEFIVELSSGNLDDFVDESALIEVQASHIISGDVLTVEPLFDAGVRGTVEDVNSLALQSEGEFQPKNLN